MDSEDEVAAISVVDTVVVYVAGNMGRGDSSRMDVWATEAEDDDSYDTLVAASTEKDVEVSQEVCGLARPACGGSSCRRAHSRDGAGLKPGTPSAM